MEILNWSSFKKLLSTRRINKNLIVFDSIRLYVSYLDNISNPIVIESCGVFHASFVIAVKPTRHFSYSSGGLSSMCILILVLACFLRCYTSLFTVSNPPCSTWEIPLWLYPLLQSSCALSLLHCTCCTMSDQMFLFLCVIFRRCSIFTLNAINGNA